jgi:hypothetical protein
MASAANVEIPDSHLFTVRLWAEDLDADQREWRGQVQHVLSGETRYFRNAAGLYGILLAIMMEQVES